MESQKKTLRTSITKEIGSLYSFTGSEITKEQVIEMAFLIVSDYSRITEKDFSSFIYDCKLGKYGIIQRNPTFLMSLIKDRFSPLKSDTQQKYRDGDLIPNPNWVEPIRHSNAERF